MPDPILNSSNAKLSNPNSPIKNSSNRNSATANSSRAPRSGKRPTILFFDHTAMMSGGEIALLHLIRHLDRARFEPVVVLSSHGPLVEALRADGIETHVLPLAASVVEARKDHLDRNALTRGRDMARLMNYALRLARFMRRRKVDLVHTNSLKSDVIGGLAGRVARVPVLWHVRDRIADDYLPPKVARVFRHLSHTLPNAVITNSQATLSTLHLPRKSLSRGQVVHDGIPTANTFAASNYTEDNASEAIPTTVIFRDDNQASISEPESAPEFLNCAPRIGIVGRISAWKGQHIFLEAAARVLREFPQARFQIIGSAMFGEKEYQRELQQQQENLGINNSVEWLGFRSDVPELIGQLDILVHASTVGEPFGQVVIEGMIAGKPVVATRGGGIPEIVEDGVSGVLVPMNDASAMTNAILDLLRNPARAKTLGIAARQRVQTNFSIEQTARKVEKIYDAMLRKR